MNDFSNGVAQLSHLGVIRVAGEDAVKFLQGQLTQDFALLDLTQARLAAFCTAKGRMLASFIGFKQSETEVLLVCNRDLLAATLKRLSMFVLRAKLKITDASDEFELAGLLGASVQANARNGLPVWGKHTQASGTFIQLYPANDLARAMWVGSKGASLPVGPAISLDAWLWTEVRSAVATLSAAVSEQFVPQMLNYESVGGVNFKKGCYPGQEIVARSQFRGAIKRRACLIHCAEAMTVSSEIFDATDVSQPCGMVVQSAANSQGGYDAIASIQTNSLENKANLHLGGPDGPILKLLPLPYSLLEDI